MLSYKSKEEKSIVRLTKIQNDIQKVNRQTFKEKMYTIQ